MADNPKGQAALMAAALAAAAAAQDEAGLDLAQLQQFMLQQLTRSGFPSSAAAAPASASSLDEKTVTSAAGHEADSAAPPDEEAAAATAAPRTTAAGAAPSTTTVAAAPSTAAAAAPPSTAAAAPPSAAAAAAPSVAAAAAGRAAAAAAPAAAEQETEGSSQETAAAAQKNKAAAEEDSEREEQCRIQFWKEQLAAMAGRQTAAAAQDGKKQAQPLSSPAAQLAAEAFKHKHLREVDASSAVVVDCADGSSAAPVSASLWSDLHLKEELLLGVEHQGFSKPSKIQAAALPLILTREENLIAQAQNGSGKTATFALAMLTKVDSALHAPQALCLCPTRELAQQTVRVIEALARFMEISIFLAIPQRSDSSTSSPANSVHVDGKCRVYTTLSSGAVSSPVVVGTPGKCMELLKKRKFPPQQIRLFVLDEADELINFTNNMAPQVQQIRRFFPPRLQILLFSATFSEEVRGFAEKLMPTANKITVKKEELTLSCIRQYYIDCEETWTAEGARGSVSRGRGVGIGGQEEVFMKKFAVLSSLYSSMCMGQSVVFVNSRRTAFSLALKMQEEGYAVSLICGTQAHGPEKMGIEMRDRIMEEFRKGETKVLICTDVLARGIDVPQVTLVVNFDLPLVYQGRVSNTSAAAASPRGGGAGTAAAGVNFFSDESRGGVGFNRSYQSQAGGSRAYINSSSSSSDGSRRFDESRFPRDAVSVQPRLVQWEAAGDESLGKTEGGSRAGERQKPTLLRVNMETYIHRIGRTGRFGLKGIAINLVTSQEQELLQQIRDFYKCTIEPLKDDPEEIEEMIQKLRI